ncbi:pantoate--beta-alanine ligase [Telluribacter sp. SYSU D00476]|uniref:pantoate--beta-alanine ligase n=1 Tax=Telluribacter sp. SYSU D00476 TaxID=2811430 RepID=UPI001FF16B7B|nr:pantoate--beta-alanine ligase [Telluribacter sp. SYSU D00476]
MQVFYTITELRAYLAAQRSEKKSIGLVPTMGALHQGHMSLIEASRQANDVTVCSIFVNPIQFTNQDDLSRYPRTLEQDYLLLEEAGCDFVFAPSADEMYNTAPSLVLDFGTLETVMEGAFRPGHFNGVGIVVARLFNIVHPDRVYFGQKDLQQLAVIRRLVEDLAFQIEVVPCPTVREADGLAMSSRNRRLSPEERAIAPHLYRALSEAQERLLNGERVADVIQVVQDYIATVPAFSLEYFEVVDARTMQPVDEVQSEGHTALCVAAHLGPVRLIDNVVF